MTLFFHAVFFRTANISLNANMEVSNNIEVKVVQQETYENLWQLEIPKIGLVANIAEGTTDAILNKYVGHFEESQLEDGNVCLAAHNRGYDVNYFSRLKELNLNDEIIYIVHGKKKIYKVSLITIINDTDWTLLENTNENKITLITCVENVPEKRRCIQAIEKEKE